MGDDVDVIQIGNEYFAFNIDGFAAKYVKLPYMDLKDVGWRGVIACLSDLVAKLVKPSYALFSIYGEEEEELAELSAGIAEALREFGLGFLGADSNRGEAAVDVVCFGGSRKLPPRISGAKPGDAVVVPKGCWGCMSECVRGEYIEHCKRPYVPLDIVNKLEKYRACISASTDSSDGLLISLYRIAISSNVRIRIVREPPGARGDWLRGGEEYLPIFITSCAHNEIAKAIDGKVIGWVEEGEPSVLFKGKPLRVEGWEWF